MSRPELLTFDCYGTLIDWEAGILLGLREACPEAESVDDRALLAEFHERQNERKTSAYRPYRTLLAEVTRALAEERGWDVDEERAGLLPASIPEWPPFPDTGPALERLAEAGFRLGILSNIDDDLLAGTLRHLPVEFDPLITAEKVQGYKPGPAHFERAVARVEGDPSRLLHVAQSLFHDVRPAPEHGIPVVWVNRAKEPLPVDLRPVAVVPDLAGAADWILARYG